MTFRRVVVATVWLVASWAALPVDNANAAAPRVTALVTQDQWVPGVNGATFDLTVTLSEPLPPDARLSITSYKRLNTRQQVHDAVAGNLVSPIDTVLIDVSTTGTVDGSDITVTIPIETESRTREALQMSAGGVYPLAIGVQQDKTVSGEIVTFIERLPDNVSTPVAAENLQVAVVGEISGPVTLQPDGTTQLAESGRAALTNAVDLMEQLPSLPVAVAAKPELVESLVRSTPEDAALLGRLQAVTSLTPLSDTYVSLDPSTAVTAQLGDTFTSQLRLGEDTLVTHLPGQPTDRSVYLVRDRLDAGGAGLLRDLGFRTLVLTHDSQKVTGNGIALMADSTRKIVFTFAGNASVDVLLADPNLSSAVTRGSQSDNPYLVAQQVLAELKVLRIETLARGETMVGRSVVLGTDDGSLPSVGFMAAFVESIASTPDISVVPLVDAIASTSISLMDGRPVAAELPVSTTAVTSALPVQILSTTSLINGYGSLLPSGDERPNMWRRLLDVLPDSGLGDADRQAYVDVITASTSAIGSAVSAPASTTFTLGGRDSSIRLTLRNDNETDLSVLVRLTSSKLSFPQGEQTVTLPAGTSTAVEIPVVARSNGRFPVTITLLTPDGSQPLGPPATFTARVNALAGLGQLVTGIALLLLVSWWAHHLRGERRKRLVASEQSAERHPAGDRN